MENELTRMQAFIRSHDTKRTVTYEDVTDSEGFARPAPAPAPPQSTPREDEPEVALANPKSALEQYQANAYPPEVVGIDLKVMKVIGTHGSFPLEEEEKRQIVAIAIRSMQRAYEKILQTLVENAGLAPTTEDANGKPVPDVNSAETTPRKRSRNPG